MGNALVGYFDLLPKFDQQERPKVVKENNDEHNDREGNSNE